LCCWTLEVDAASTLLPTLAAHAPQKHDVEQLLWKAVFYRPIEEFRCVAW
jgi:hypothetical protein